VGNQDSITISIVENNEIGTVILEAMPIFSKDMVHMERHQKGTAGAEYHLEPGEVNKLLKADARTGTIYARTSFDHELTDEIRFDIVAMETWNPTRILKLVHVTLIVIDEDDEVPEFSSGHYIFHVEHKVGIFHCTWKMESIILECVQCIE